MKKKCFFLLITTIITLASKAQGQWNRKGDFPILNSSATSFSIGDKGYVVTGANDKGGLKCFYEYDSKFDSWTQLTDFPGGERYGTFSFCLNNIAYLAGGYLPIQVNPDTMIRNPFDDFWAYNGASKTWHKKAALPTGPRFDAVGFNIGDRGFIALGNDTTGKKKDLWEYFPSTDSWSRKADFPDSATKFSIAFSINGYAYVGTGFSNTKLIKSFYRYNPDSNNWLKLKDLDTAIYYAAGFPLNGKGYIIGGISQFGFQKSVLEYNPNTNSWTYLPPFSGLGRAMGSSFTIGNKAFFGLGVDSNYLVKKDFWEFSQTGSGVEKLPEPTAIKVYPNPVSTKLILENCNQLHKILIKDLLGREVSSTDVQEFATRIDLNLSNLPSGCYTIHASSAKGEQCIKIIKN